MSLLTGTIVLDMARFSARPACSCFVVTLASVKPATVDTRSFVFHCENLALAPSISFVCSEPHRDSVGLATLVILAPKSTCLSFTAAQYPHMSFDKIDKDVTA